MLRFILPGLCVTKTIIIRKLDDKSKNGGKSMSDDLDFDIDELEDEIPEEIDDIPDEEVEDDGEFSIDDIPDEEEDLDEFIRQAEEDAYSDEDSSGDYDELDDL